MVTVHGRTRDQGFSGQVRLGPIAAVRAALPKEIPVVGNGDVKTVDDYRRMKSETGCDAVMIGRAARGNPWLFRAIHAIETGAPAAGPAHIVEQRAVWRRHADLVVEYASAKMRLHELRKTLAWYSRGLYGGADLRRRAFSEPQPQAVIDLGEASLPPWRRASRHMRRHRRGALSPRAWRLVAWPATGAVRARQETRFAQLLIPALGALPWLACCFARAPVGCGLRGSLVSRDRRADQHAHQARWRSPSRGHRPVGPHRPPHPAPDRDRSAHRLAARQDQPHHGPRCHRRSRSCGHRATLRGLRRQCRGAHRLRRAAAALGCGQRSPRRPRAPGSRAGGEKRAKGEGPE
jgi:hypothetical protein